MEIDFAWWARRCRETYKSYQWDSESRVWKDIYPSILLSSERRRFSMSSDFYESRENHQTPPSTSILLCFWCDRYFSKFIQNVSMMIQKLSEAVEYFHFSKEKCTIYAQRRRVKMGPIRSTIQPSSSPRLVWSNTVVSSRITYWGWTKSSLGYRLYGLRIPSVENSSEGQKFIIFDEVKQVKMQIEIFNVFSGHADRESDSSIQQIVEIKTDISRAWRKESMDALANGMAELPNLKDTPLLHQHQEIYFDVRTGKMWKISREIWNATV